ncbi:MAG: ABC transporter ATP-binding protein [Anaerolineae bacterium]|nr:ABC transporter ATP-binding protein [Anaerolineae bacterium]
MLRLENISKTYHVGTFGGKELHAVSDVSFEIADGEVVSLIGESGSGKSTIGRMILRLTPISSGAILNNGVNIATLKRSALKEYYRTVQGVFQNPFGSCNPIFKADRIFRIIREEFYPGISEVAWTDKVHRAMESVGLNPRHVLNKYPHQLSGGQVQRFLIARALLLDIQLLVADEIISMLDASTRIDVLNLLADLKERGLSILFITHDLSLGYYISEKSVILYRGCIAEMGDTGKIYESPRHPYTRMLMAAVPRMDKVWEKMNIELKAKDSELGPGCVYYGRCQHAGKDQACTTSRPPLVEVEPNHFVACHKVP